jgi:uncharacterized phage-associated protein
MTTALAVANAFIRLADANGSAVSNMKLQKLVYFAQGFHAAIFGGAPLFEDDIEAWKYGPVIPDLYHKFKIYLAGPIPLTHPFQTEEALAANQESLVKWVYANMGQHSAIKLSDFSHTPGSPWDVVFNGKIPDRTIDVASMVEYFRGLVAKNRPVAQPAVT